MAAAAANADCPARRQIFINATFLMNKLPRKVIVD
jgi:hypothetical protein